MPAAVAPEAASTTNGEIGEEYVACYPYQSSEVGDLIFDAGEQIRVIKKEGDWWTGVIGNRTGIFPSNYVQLQSAAPVEPPVAAETTIQATVVETIEISAHYEEESTVNGTAAAAISAAQIRNALNEEAKNQADLDSEVSQINTQTPTNDSNVQEFRSMSTSATPVSIFLSLFSSLSSFFPISLFSSLFFLIWSYFSSPLSPLFSKNF